MARVLPADHIVRSPLREPLLTLWMLIAVGVVATIVSLDGGVDSPATILFVIPILFVALTSPLPVTMAVAAVDVAAFLTVAITSGDDRAYAAFTAFGLMCAAVISVLEARNQARRREELAGHRGGAAGQRGDQPPAGAPAAGGGALRPARPERRGHRRAAARGPAGRDPGPRRSTWRR